MPIVTVPATLANLGPGYDTLGAAVALENRFSIVPGEPDPADLVWQTAAEAGRRFGVPCPPFGVVQQEEVPRARGLGSSATARVAGLLGWRALTSSTVPEIEQLAFLAEEEGHPDNVWPALLGGVVVCGDRPRRLVPHASIRVALAIPAYEVSTAAARALLPARVEHAAAVGNLRCLASLLLGLLDGDPDALAEGVHDRLHQPFRAELLGPVEEAFAAARALGGAPFVSGSGSTLAAFSTMDRADGVAEALARPYRRGGHEVRTCSVAFLARGARVL